MPTGNLQDYITGKFLLDTPEERVRQEMERWLHEMMGYRKEQMDIEFTIQMGTARKRADIVIFESSNGKYRSQQNDVVGIVETKAPKKRGTQGRSQLHSYMAACSQCQWGIRDYGGAKEFFHKDGGEIISAIKIPRRGESMLSAARLRKKDLKPTENLKAIFRSILEKTYNNLGSDRTRLCNEIAKLLFCKIHDENRMRKLEDTPLFQAPYNEKPREIKRRIKEELWEDVQKSFTSARVFKKTETLEMNPAQLAEIVAELECIDLLATQSDVIGTAFEVFAERYFKGEKGEFFTPRPAVQAVVNILDPKLGETIVDPACGSGGFLIQSLEHLWSQAGQAAHRSHVQAANSVYGIDIEPNLVKLARAYMLLVGDGHSNIAEGDSLLKLNKLNRNDSMLHVLLADGDPRLFDLVMTNPPFGEKIKIKKHEILSDYELARSPKVNSLRPTAPQVLFLERCLDLLVEGGRMAIVLPEGVVGNPTNKHIREFVLRNATVDMIIDCPKETFLPYTQTKTCIVFIRKQAPGQGHNILMSLVKECGHDARGNPTGRDDFPKAVTDWQNHRANGDLAISRSVLQSNLDATLSLVPSRYVGHGRVQKKASPSQPTIGDMVASNLIEVRTLPCGVRQADYIERGGVPFLKTSCIANHEITFAKDRVPIQIYKRESSKQNLQANDILLVKDGDTRIGNAIILQEDELKMVVQGHFFQIKVNSPDKVDAYWLFSALHGMKSEMRRSRVIQTTLGALSKEAFLNLPLSPPPIQKQRQVGKRVRRILENRRQLLREYEAL